MAYMASFRRGQPGRTQPTYRVQSAMKVKMNLQNENQYSDGKIGNNGNPKVTILWAEASFMIPSCNLHR